MIRSDGNSWINAAVAPNGMQLGVAEPVTSYATASIAITASAGGRLTVFRGASAIVAQIDAIDLEPGVSLTYIVPAVESYFRVSYHNDTVNAGVCTCEVFYYEALAAVAPTSDTRVGLIGSATGSTAGNLSTLTPGIDVSGFRDCLLHLSPGTGTGLAYFHVFLTTAAGHQYMHGVWTETGTHQVNWFPSGDSGTCAVPLPPGTHSVFVQLTQNAPYETNTYTLEVTGRKV
jgi:hypothetical protein